MTDNMTEAELADHYNESEDISEFDLEYPEPVTIRRDVTISVRLSADEIAELCARADQDGVKSPPTSEWPPRPATRSTGRL